MDIDFRTYTEEFQSSFKQHLPEVWSELRKLLPELVDLDKMKFYFNNDYLIPKMMVGGAKISPTKILLAAETDRDYSELASEMRKIIFHEAYHIAQNATPEAHKNMSALENGVHEGSACVFEIEYANSNPYYAEFDQGFVDKWLPAITALGPDWTNEYRRWKFYDKETDTNHILYRLGTYTVRRALEKSDKDIIDLANLSPKEIIELAELDA